MPPIRFAESPANTCKLGDVSTCVASAAGAPGKPGAPIGAGTEVAAGADCLRTTGELPVLVDASRADAAVGADACVDSVLDDGDSEDEQAASNTLNTATLNAITANFRRCFISIAFLSCALRVGR